MKKFLSGVLIIAAFLVVTTVVVAAAPSDKGFNQYGYNYSARIFNGTSWDWCFARNWTSAQCSSYFGNYVNDKLVMKWNAEWDRGNAENWGNPPYAAWEDNEWNGRSPEGSGEIWHYKIAWDKGCASSAHAPSGEVSKGEAYCLWGPFAMISSQGSTQEREHIWEVLLNPAGYGAY